jgi:hypothetical protein
VALGWIGCPLFGFTSDKLGRRKPVVLGGAGVLAWILFGNPAILRGPVVGILLGVAAAILPYSVIKDANPPELGGSATGVINFINFAFSAPVGPVAWSAAGPSARRRRHHGPDTLSGGVRTAPYGIVLALVLSCFLKENGPAARQSVRIKRILEFAVFIGVIILSALAPTM